jgi:ABC-type transport system involved in multi-copper enzyme maturation permease subunit
VREVFPGPVFHAELLALARRRRYYTLRFLYGALLLFFVAVNAPWSRVGGPVELSIQELSRAGQSMAAVFTWTEAVGLLLVTPALVAGVIADERQRKTLHYLLASRLSSTEIVAGKLAARLLLLGVFAAVGLPVLVMISLFGGVDPNATLLLFGCGACTAFFLASLSIVVSVHAARPRDAVTAAYAAEALWLFGPSVVRGVLRHAPGLAGEVYRWVEPVVEFFGASSPLHAIFFSAVAWGGSPGSLYAGLAWMAGLQVAFGAVLLAVAVARLRPVHRKDGGPARGSSGPAAGAAWRRWRMPRPACGDDAMLWKELFVSRTGRWMRLVQTLAYLAAVGLIVYGSADTVAASWNAIRTQGFFEAANGDAGRDLNSLVRFTATVVFSFWTLAVGVAAAGGLTGEREEDTWVSLIATPLSAVEILRAKMLGALWSTRWVGLAWGALIATGVALGGLHPLGAAAVSAVTAVDLAFACALGTFYSLRLSRSSRALTATVATLFVCNGAYLMVLVPLMRYVGPGTVFFFLGVTPFVEATSLMSYADVSRLAGEGLSDGSKFEIVCTCFLSVGLYAGLAGLLTLDVLSSFDRLNGRPARSGRGPTVRKPDADDLDELPATPG